MTQSALPLSALLLAASCETTGGQCYNALPRLPAGVCPTCPARPHPDTPLPLAADVNNVNSALSKFPELAGLGIDDLNKRVGTPGAVPDEVATAVRNNGGG